MSEVDTALTGADAAPVPEEAVTTAEVQETPQTTADAEQDAQAEEQPRDEKGKFVQKRINELTRRYHDEQRARTTLEQEVQQLREKFDRATQPPPPDFNDDPQAYFAHLAREEARSYIESHRQTETQQQEKQRFQSLAQQLNTREAEYVVAHPDYPEAAEALASVIGPNPIMFEVIATSDHGPAVAHYLGNHLDEAANIARMPSHLAAAAVARLEAKVSAPKPKPVSNAPAPAPVLGGGSTVQKDPERMSTEEWLAWRRDQLKAQ